MTTALSLYTYHFCAIIVLLLLPLYIRQFISKSIQIIDFGHAMSETPFEYVTKLLFVYRLKVAIAALQTYFASVHSKIDLIRDQIWFTRKTML